MLNVPPLRHGYATHCELVGVIVVVVVVVALHVPHSFGQK